MTPSFQIFVGLLITFLVSGCGYNNTQLPQNGNGQSSGADKPEGARNTQGPVPGFTEVFQNVIGPRCVECHSSTSAAAGIDLSTYSALRPHLNLIQTAVQNGSMPPRRRGPLVEEQKNLILAWLAGGAPEQAIPERETNAPTNPPTNPPSNPPTNPPTDPGGPPVGVDEIPGYEDIKPMVFESYCLRCHNSQTARSGVDLSSYEQAFRHARDVKFVVETGLMPPRGTLPQDSVDLIVRWVNGGAPERRQKAGQIIPPPTPPPSVGNGDEDRDDDRCRDKDNFIETIKRGDKKRCREKT